jgi:hypothetical protein
LINVKTFVNKFRLTEPSDYSFFIQRRILNFLNLLGLTDLSASVGYSLMWHENEKTMKAILKNYHIINGVIAPLYDENYLEIYGFIDYKGKVVLDVGAEVGSTAQFFLSEGASSVIAIEGSDSCFSKLKANAKQMGNVIPLKIYINETNHFEELIRHYKPDIVKVDIEGSEIHLFNISDSIFCSVKNYLVEVHSIDLLEKFKQKCVSNGYSMSFDDNSNPLINGLCGIVFAWRC